MKFVPFFAATALTVMSLISNADQSSPSSNWGVSGAVPNTYTLGASQLVPKDHGVLEINLQVNCMEKAADVSDGLSKIQSRLDQDIQIESNSSLSSVTSEVNVSPQLRYQEKYDQKDINYLNPYYVDVCNNNARVDLGKSAIDLTETVFAGTTTLRIEAKNSLSELTVLRQKFQQVADTVNKEDPKKQVVVNSETLIVSAEKRKEVLKTLNDQTRLSDAYHKTSRIGIDAELSGGFSSLFISSAATREDTYPEYGRYSPELTGDGKSKINVPYIFTIRYIPKNIANDQSVPWTGAEEGSLSQTITGTAEIPTDYYSAELTFKTQCQPTKETAAESLTNPYAEFKKQAQAVIGDRNASLYERLEENIGTPEQDDKWQDWEKEISQENHDERTITKSYLNLCDGQIVTGSKPETLTYEVTHSLTLVTKNFAGLKALKQSALTFTEGQRAANGSKRVVVELRGIAPHLTNANQFEAVDVLAYRSAVNQLVDPQGEVAKKLLDEIQAGQAYYTVARGGNNERSLAASAPTAASARPKSFEAPGGAPVIVTSDEDIALSEIRVSSTYNVVYHPNKDLITILQEKRNAQAPGIPLNPAP